MITSEEDVRGTSILSRDRGRYAVAIRRLVDRFEPSEAVDPSRDGVWVAGSGNRKLKFLSHLQLRIPEDGKKN